ncbi:MAG: helix-turn-helix domain-containing protein [Pseudomonadota bacterium]
MAATLDILRAASSLAPRVGACTPKWRVCSPFGGTVHLQSGLLVESVRLPVDSKSDSSTWILPGLGLNTEGEIRSSLDRPDLQRLVRALQTHVRRGGRVAAGCSSVFLLEFAGLLDGKRVTTTWWLAPLLQRMNPRCQVDAARMVCADGPIVTAGAAFAQTDLMLHLLRDAVGPKLVDAICRFLLVDARDAQSRYVVPEVMAGNDALVGRIVSHVEKSLPEVPSVASLARDFCVSERTLARRVRKVTGKGTLALLQSIRLRRARALLEQSRLSVEQVASAVGYGDPTALRRLMRKFTGGNPSQYRPAAI